MWPHARAGILLLVYACILVLSGPGLRSLPDSPEEAERLMAGSPAPLVSLAKGLVLAETVVREPLADRIGPVQRPLRLAQEWALYGAGPAAVHRMEIRVDGLLVHRTQDPEHDWLAWPLRHRRIRPMVESVVMKPAPENRPGLERYILTQARAQWPAAQEVSLQFVKTPYHGEPTRYRIRAAAAPDWAWKTTYRVKR